MWHRKVCAQEKLVVLLRRKPYVPLAKPHAINFVFKPEQCIARHKIKQGNGPDDKDAPMWGTG